MNRKHLRGLFFEADKGFTLSAEERTTLLEGAKGWKAVQDKADTIEKELAKAASAEELTKLKGDFDKLVEDCRKLQKANLSAVTRGTRRKGEVSQDAAAHLGALAIIAGLKGGQISGDRFGDIAKGFLGEERYKAALTSSDIPLPTEFSGDIVELVAAWGKARQLGTVFPLGAGTVKLPKLTTDPTFGLIAASATVTERSPQAGWVTFNPEKFGGLIRLPSELDEDSVIAIGQFVARYAARNLARAEDYNFFASTGAGSGVNGTAKGLAALVVDNSKTVALASTKTKYSDVTLAKVRELRTVVDSPALAVGRYAFHPSFESAFAGFNTAGDKPYQANGLNGATLDGFPIDWVDALPAYSASNNASKVFGLFGDLSFHYLGIRGGIRMDTSKEAGFTTDEILMRALERFTTGLMADGAVGGIITAAS